MLELCSNSVSVIYQQGENAFCRFCLPENNTSRHVVLAISKNLKLMDRDGKIIPKPFKSDEKQWRNFTEERFVLLIMDRDIKIIPKPFKSDEKQWRNFTEERFLTTWTEKSYQVFQDGWETVEIFQ